MNNHFRLLDKGTNNKLGLPSNLHLPQKSYQDMKTKVRTSQSYKS